MNKLRERLKEVRHSLNLTEEEVARKLGKTSNSFVSRIENGPQKLNIDMINQLCQVYQIDPLSLFQESKIEQNITNQGFFSRIAFRADEQALTPAAKENITKLLPNLRKLGKVMRNLDEEPLSLKDFYSAEIRLNNAQMAKRCGKEVANALRKYVNLGNAPIVNIQNFIWHYLKIPVCGTDLDKDCWGFYSKDNYGNPLILFSTSHRFQQRNVFTIAHELGHHFFDPEEGQIDCGNTLNDISIQEKIANAFAQELLVPTDALNEYYDEHGLNFVTLEPKHIVELCEHFTVSYHMMCLVLYLQEKITKDKRETLLELGKKQKLQELDYFKDFYAFSWDINTYLERTVAKALRKNKINKLLASEILNISTKEVEKLI